MGSFYTLATKIPCIFPHFHFLWKTIFGFLKLIFPGWAEEKGGISWWEKKDTRGFAWEEKETKRRKPIKGNFKALYSVHVISSDADIYRVTCLIPKAREVTWEGAYWRLRHLFAFFHLKTVSYRPTQSYVVDIVGFKLCQF